MKPVPKPWGSSAAIAVSVVWHCAARRDFTLPTPFDRYPLGSFEITKASELGLFKGAKCKLEPQQKKYPDAIIQHTSELQYHKVNRKTARSSGDWQPNHRRNMWQRNTYYSTGLLLHPYQSMPEHRCSGCRSPTGDLLHQRPPSAPNLAMTGNPFVLSFMTTIFNHLC